MNIFINGQEQTVEDGISLATLLADLKIDRRYCAVERNLTVVPREHHADCRLEPADRLEIVTLVGGG